LVGLFVSLSFGSCGSVPTDCNGLEGGYGGYGARLGFCFWLLWGWLLGVVISSVCGAGVLDGVAVFGLDGGSCCGGVLLAAQ